MFCLFVLVSITTMFGFYSFYEFIPKMLVHKLNVAHLQKLSSHLIRRKELNRGCAVRHVQHQHQQGASSKIEWFYIPAGVGIGLMCMLQVRHLWRKNNRQEGGVVGEDKSEGGFVFQQWQVAVMKMLPSRFLSRMWGQASDLHLPVWLRGPLINTYSSMFGCDLAEAAIEDVAKYNTFNEFFTRRLKPGARKVDADVTMVSPADCTVLSFGRLNTAKDVQLEQVKGMTYPLNTFLGPRHPFYTKLKSFFPDDSQVYKAGSCNQDLNDTHRIFYCTLYLAPGDYHWFHSPVEWTVDQRRHVPGDLFSVHPRCLRTINGIFHMNERVLLSGRWQHGPLLYAAVGAYNVGSIQLDFPNEKNLETNSHFNADGFKDRHYGAGIRLKRGEAVGKFKLGSSIILVFTAPKDFQFTVQPGTCIKYGTPLGDCQPQEKL